MAQSSSCLSGDGEEIQSDNLQSGSDRILLQWFPRGSICESELIPKRPGRDPRKVRSIFILAPMITNRLSQLDEGISELQIVSHQSKKLLEKLSEAKADRSHTEVVKIEFKTP